MEASIYNNNTRVKIIKECFDRFISNGASPLGETSEHNPTTFVDNMKQFLAAHLWLTDNVFSEIMEYRCERCVICFNSIISQEDYLYIICELCVKECAQHNYQMLIYTDTQNNSMQFTYVKQHQEYDMRGPLYYSDMGEHWMIRDNMMTSTNNIITGKPLSLNHHENGSHYVDKKLYEQDMKGNPYPITIYHKMIDNCDKLFHRYRKTTTLLFIMALNDDTSPISMLLFDVVVHVLRLIY